MSAANITSLPKTADSYTHILYTIANLKYIIFLPKFIKILRFSAAVVPAVNIKKGKDITVFARSVKHIAYFLRFLRLVAGALYCGEKQLFVNLA